MQYADFTHLRERVMAMICDNLSVSPGGHLLFAGQDVVELARQYGTPLYLMDEDRLRANCRRYQEAFRRHFGNGSRPLYAKQGQLLQAHL